MSHYPHGWSFWSREEWKQLKNKRTDHHCKMRTNPTGILMNKRSVTFVEPNDLPYQKPLTPKITLRPKTAPNNFRPRPLHDNGKNINEKIIY